MAKIVDITTIVFKQGSFYYRLHCNDCLQTEDYNYVHVDMATVGFKHAAIHVDNFAT